VELVRQGRAALATSFAGYKFLIMYGETMCFLELIQYYFTVVVPQWIWVLIDGFVTVGLSYALTQALPAKHLSAQRPTARLLGPETLASTIIQVIINLLFLTCSILLLFRQPWFRCNEFDASAVDAAKWWLLGDNYESVLITAITLPQFINAAATFNFGYRFRRAWWRNYTLVACYLGMMTFVSYIILADPNPVGCWFRTNCGDPDVLVKLGYPRPTWNIERYNSPLGHNVLPYQFRWTIWGYAMANCAVNLLFEYFIILGPVREWAKRRFPIKRLELIR
jgi:cation-transporting ATPase 13A3/4/5